MKEVDISIIMGIYNCEKYLKESINSILEQTFKSWELIMCDDGSIDQTYDIALEYKNKYPDKIKLIKNEKNMGLNFTLNKCLKLAEGKYIARQDGDDISLPDRLEKEYNFLENNKKYALVSSKATFFDKKGEWGETNLTEKPTKYNFLIGPPFVHAAVLIRKKVLDEVNGYTVDKKLIRVEDYHLWSKIYEKGYVGYNINKVLYKIRDDEEALKRITFRSRINEAILRFTIYKKLKIPFYKYYYCLRPIIMLIIPKSIYSILHRRKLKENRKC